MRTPLFCVLLLAGCPKGTKLPSFDLDELKPEVRYSTMNVQQVDFDGAKVDFVLSVDNPNPIGLKMADYAYDLDVGGGDFLDGTNADGLQIAANGTRDVTIPVSLKFGDLLDVAGAMKGKDAVPFALAGELGFDTKLGRVGIPYSHQGNLPVVRAPEVKLKGLKVGKVDLLKQTAALDLQIGLAHDNGATLKLDGFDYAIKLAGNDVASGLVKELASVDGGKEQVVSLPIELKLVDLGKTVVDAITKKEKLNARLTGSMKVGTPLGVIPLSIDSKELLQLK